MQIIFYETSAQLFCQSSKIIHYRNAFFPGLCRRLESSQHLAKSSAQTSARGCLELRVRCEFLLCVEGLTVTESKNSNQSAVPLLGIFLYICNFLCHEYLLNISLFSIPYLKHFYKKLHLLK